MEFCCHRGCDLDGVPWTLWICSWSNLNGKTWGKKMVVLTLSLWELTFPEPGMLWPLRGLGDLGFCSPGGGYKTAERICEGK